MNSNEFHVLYGIAYIYYNVVYMVLNGIVYTCNIPLRIMIKAICNMCDSLWDDVKRESWFSMLYVNVVAA